MKNFENLSNDELRELWLAVQKAVGIMEQGRSLTSMMTDCSEKYKEVYMKLIEANFVLFHQHIKRQSNNTNI